MNESVEHFLRLQLLLQECCKVLRVLFKHKAENDATTGVRYTTLFAYLQHYEPQIKHLLQKKVLCREQYDILFQSGNYVTEEDFDITLLACLLINIFVKSLSQEQWITDIRKVRNTLNHHPGISKIDSKQFNIYWKDLEIASNNLATNIDPAYANEVLQTVKELSSKPLPISSQFLDIIKDILNVNADLREELKGIKASAEITNSYLKNVTKVTKVTKGKHVASCKRIKTVDNRLEKMKERFLRTMASHLPDNFEPPDEYQNMRSKLLGFSRRLCLIGSKSSTYLTSAVHLAKSLDIDSDRCVEMTRFSEWDSIDTDEIGLVLYRDPIGSNKFMPGLVQDAHGCFDRILCDTQDQSTEDGCYVIITMETDIFAEYSKNQDEDIHGIFDDHFDFQKITTGEDVDIMSCKRNANKRNTEYPVLTNLQVQTKTYLEFHKRWIPLPEAIVNDAATLLQQRNMLHIDGPENTGKTSLAAHLMTPFDERCIRLREANDVRHIRIGDGFAILIEDFTGKYKPNEAEALKWFGVFDILLPAVRSGKLSVIIVTESTSFKLSRLPPHALLQHCLTLKSPTEAVMRDVERTQSDKPDETLRYDSCARSLLEASFHERRSFTIPFEYEYGINGCAFLPNGLIVVAYSGTIIVVDQLDDLCNYPTFRCLGKGNINYIATLSFNEVVVGFHKTSYLQYVSFKKHGLELKDGIGLEEGCDCSGLDVRGGEIFVLCKLYAHGEFWKNWINDDDASYEVRVFDRNGTIQRTVHLNLDLNLGGHFSGVNSLKVSSNGKRLYVNHCDGVLCFSSQGNRIYHYPDDYDDYESGSISVMYVDDEDNLLVNVTNGFNGKIFLLDKDGKKKENALRFTRDTREITCVSYRPSDNCLVVFGVDDCSIIDVKW